ncbi:MAG: right-handed parallel beta-helix repeat-containing protein [Candidatus Woesearchaeota archaeon]|nr:right-handed parallel beta-helix repeat-containing protein [Candidatus Woesearchaeota archaeon]
MNITNNTIINAGVISKGGPEDAFRIGDTTYSYNDTEFDTSIMLPGDISYILTISSNDFNVSKIVTGKNNFTLCLLDLNGFNGLNFVYIYIEQPMHGAATSCQEIADSLDSALYLNVTDYLGSNGEASDYSVNDSVEGLSIINGADPAYLRYDGGIQGYFPLDINTGNNWANISGNTIEITDRRNNLYSMNVTADETLAYDSDIWLNSFYSSGVNYSNNVYFCANEEGNFYRENVAPAAGDCGQNNITYPANGTVLHKEINTTSNISWIQQSSQNSLNYSIYLVNSSGRFYVNRTSSLSTIIKFAYRKADNYTLQVAPFDGRYNGTDRNISIDIEGTGTNAPTLTSVLLNATSASNTTDDNLTANPMGVNDIDGDNVEVNYNWYRDGVSETALNMPFTMPDSLDMTYDFSGNGNDGTVYNAVFNAAGGYDGFGAYEFDGIDSYIATDDIDVEYITITAWVKAEDGTPGYIVNKNYDGGYVPYSLSVGGDEETDGMAFYGDDGWKSSGINTDIRGDGKWHFIAGVFDGGTLSYYVDGVLDSSSEPGSGLPANDEDVNIGAYLDDDAYFNGTIDEVRIYDRSLSENEIALIYNNRTNTTHPDAIGSGENWTVKATPIDSFGLNGSGYFSNGLIVTYMEMYLVNQTNPSGEIIDETNPIRSDQNLTIRFDVTNIGGSISSVWIIIWQTVASAGNILWQGVMSLIGGLWQVQVPVNASYPTYVNYTVFANDTANRTTQTEGNFITFGKNISACGILNSANTTYYLTNNITSVLTCLNVTANNVTIDGNGYWITYGTAGTANTYGIVVDNFNFTVIKNARITEGKSTGSYKSGIYFNKSSNGSISNSLIIASTSYSYGIYLFTRSNFNTIFNNTINSSGNYGHNIYIYSNSNSNNIEKNTMYGKNNQIYTIYMLSSTLNTVYNNTVIFTSSLQLGYGIGSDANSNVIKNNTINASGNLGIYIHGNTNNATGNIVTTTTAYGIEIYQGTLNNISNNQVNSSQSSSYAIYGTTLANHNNTIGPDNLAEGKPVNYTFNASNLVINNTDYTNYGEVMFGYSRNITIMNSNFSDDSLNLFNTSISNISNNMINTSNGYGIHLFSSSNYNNITNNVINTSGSGGYAIYLSTNPKGNIIDGNKIKTSGGSAHCVFLTSTTTDSIVERNQLISASSGYGMSISGSSVRNLITNNSITGTTGVGIYLSSSHNAFVDNDITTTTAFGLDLENAMVNITMDKLRVTTT